MLTGRSVTHTASGGLWKTTDGGKNWKRLNEPSLKNGLPDAKWGRIGLDYSCKTKGLIYAIIDTDKVGTGDPIQQVFMGIIGESVEERAARSSPRSPPTAPPRRPA